MTIRLHIALYLLLSIVICPPATAQKFTISYTPASSHENFSGKVFLYLSKENKNPKDGMIGVEMFPCFAISVKNIKPMEKVLFDDAAVSYPVALSDIERGEYNVEAVWDKNLGGRSIGDSPGNMYNMPVTLKLTKNRDQAFNIVCTEVIKEKPFIETQYIKKVKASSALLTAFYKRPATIDAAVLLPKEYYEQPVRRFPVLY